VERDHQGSDRWFSLWVVDGGDVWMVVASMRRGKIEKRK